MKNIYSHHVFLFPFKYNGENLIDDERWRNFSIYAEDQCVGDQSYLSLKTDYMLSQYFNHEAKKVIIGEDAAKKTEPSVNNYRHIKMCEQCPAHYHITFQSEKVQNYQLDIVDIRLKSYGYPLNDLYVLAFYLENTRYEELDDMKRINEYGRRLFTPWIPVDDDISECSDGLGITFGSPDNPIIRIPNMTNFDEQDYNYRVNKVIRKHVQSPITATDLVIYELLFGRSKDKHLKDEIELLLDDRMFVCSIIKSDEMIKNSKKISIEDDAYSYLYNDVCSDVIYSLVFCDLDTPTCQSKYMRRDLLKNSVYDRWIDYGTLYGFTQHAMICITTDDAPIDTVINPFIIEYVEMAILALIQRCALLDFSLCGSEIDFDEDDKTINYLNELQGLQRRYITFKNKFLICEITPQEQGIDIYKNLQDKMMVSIEKEELDDQINAMYEMANIMHDKSSSKSDQQLNKIAMGIGISALILTLISVIYDRFDTFNSIIENDSIFASRVSENGFLLILVEWFSNKFIYVYVLLLLLSVVVPVLYFVLKLFSFIIKRGRMKK